MAVERITRITATSPKSFEHALDEGLKRANKTLRGLTRIDILSHAVRLEQGKIKEYEVTLDITFVLE
ncbi:MAG: hypothetical protein A2V67_04315 [Deltaproteobacteria bacterium RBG_13_61_14]|nr:MAG: hypothetical protein A2V67_04315 [Deltaproteobacteria bacterium RBG_13_61_14]